MCLAEIAGGRLVRVQDGWDRERLTHHLLDEGRRDPDLIVGLDFAFSLPAWFLRERGLRSVEELWALADRDAESWLAQCQPPFWGRPGRGKPELPEHFRRTDREVPAVGGIRPKSVFQIGGAGAVGTGSLRGMKLLHRLHEAGFSIWPFDVPAWPRVVEIYPRVLTGPVNKSRREDRLAYLEGNFPELPAGMRSLAASTDDAFDAAVSALVMARHEPELLHLPPVEDAEILLEGLIWHPVETAPPAGDGSVPATAETAPPKAALRALPSVNALLERPGLARIAARYGRDAARGAAQAAIDRLRDRLRERTPDASPDRDELLARAESLAVRHARQARRSTLRRVINATGVVIHTNLGRAPLARSAARAAARAAQGYVALEYDLETGTRGSRYVHCERLLRELTDAGGALVVNNNAAALLLALNTTAEGRAVLVSRGEMVEIGGGFRVHEILGKSGARLVEVGATNKTHPADYARALREVSGGVGAILKVHRSNFVQTGFVAEVGLPELARIIEDDARERGTNERVALVFDQGSGMLADLEPLGLTGEAGVADALAAGADLVAFSGDKLLGGPQAGVLVGRGDWIGRAKRNPLTRALRVDKLTLAALEATLQLHRGGEQFVRLPVLALLRRTRDELRTAAEALLDSLGDVPGLDAEIMDTETRVGGGSLPGAALPGVGVALRMDGLEAHELEARLRRDPAPVIGRIVESRVVLELRSVPEGDLPRLGRVVRRAVAGAKPRRSRGGWAASQAETPSHRGTGMGE